MAQRKNKWNSLIVNCQLSIVNFLLCLGWVGCIENDLPYPTIVGQIEEMAVTGMQSARIQSTASTVEITVADTVDLRRVRVEKLVVTEGMTVRPDSAACLDYLHFPETGFTSADSLPEEANTYMDFRNPVKFRLSLYQDYEWTVTVTQAIERTVKVKNQVGSALIDPHTRNVIVYVDSAAQPSLRNIEIEAFQLGSSIAQTVPDPMQVTDFTRPRLFYVTAFDETETWTVSVQYPTANVQLTQLSAWTRRAYVSGSLSEGDVAAEYRKAGEETWEPVLSHEITRDGEDFLILMTHLSPGTDYEYRLTLNGSVGEVQTFTTDTVMSVPNLNFDDWVQRNERTWYPNPTLDDADHFWDSGNEGASIASRNPTMPETGDVVSGTAVRMASDYISIASKFAAGNIYTGDFVGLAGIEGAELDFGQPYTGRPSALKGYYKYTPGTIDQAKAPYEALLGETDSCHIYIGLFDWSTPFRVNTTTGTFVDLTWNNESMIAFGELKTNQPTTGSDYTPFRIDLTYRDYFTRPTYILIVASASKYGDYFTGSTSSVMYLDECELVFE